MVDNNIYSQLRENVPGDLCPCGDNIFRGGLLAVKSQQGFDLRQFQGSNDQKMSVFY